METKMITIPFEVEKAKQIQAGTLPGKIVNRTGRDARVICFDAKLKGRPIAALTEWVCNKEELLVFCHDGRFLETGKDSCYDLMLQVPEYTQFKDGDVLATKSGNIFILNADGEFKTSCHAGLFHGKLSFGGAAYSDCIERMTYATEKQIQELVGELKASADPRAKEYLKRFFGIEEKPEQKFEFLQPVLIRNNGSKCSWKYGRFTHFQDGKAGRWYFVDGGGHFLQCIPYNEQTKHLLGTTDNWEAQP